MVEIKITIGPDAFDSGHFIYVWFKSNPNREPFYVGETSKSLADRAGLHIRKCGSEARSGTVVGKLMHDGNWPTQEYTVRVGRMRPQAVIRRMWRSHTAEGAAFMPFRMLFRPPNTYQYDYFHEYHAIYPVAYAAAIARRV